MADFGVNTVDILDTTITEIWIHFHFKL